MVPNKLRKSTLLTEMGPRNARKMVAVKSANERGIKHPTDKRQTTFPATGFFSKFNVFPINSSNCFSSYRNLCLRSNVDLFHNLIPVLYHHKDVAASRSA